MPRPRARSPPPPARGRSCSWPRACVGSASRKTERVSPCRRPSTPPTRRRRPGPLSTVRRDLPEWHAADVALRRRRLRGARRGRAAAAAAGGFALDKRREQLRALAAGAALGGGRARPTEAAVVRIAATRTATHTRAVPLRSSHWSARRPAASAPGASRPAVGSLPLSTAAACPAPRVASTLGRRRRAMRRRASDLGGADEVTRAAGARAPWGDGGPVGLRQSDASDGRARWSAAASCAGGGGRASCAPR